MISNAYKLHINKLRLGSYKKSSMYEKEKKKKEKEFWNNFPNRIAAT